MGVNINVTKARIIHIIITFFSFLVPAPNLCVILGKYLQNLNTHPKRKYSLFLQKINVRFIKMVYLDKVPYNNKVM
ncbi:hypothetical protein SPI02_21700 [Staphylococcus piscifermentans]|uniref:Uncharacterized protein n=1 Tax=Staphylococcus piscifermentans TaxID=70258 RepID=A0A512QQ65_9STAP|nr:hypothetical protein SPI02_21700 [Staphylococcus piscifermentans]